jgi:hypothetical protein
MPATNPSSHVLAQFLVLSRHADGRSLYASYASLVDAKAEADRMAGIGFGSVVLDIADARSVVYQNNPWVQAAGGPAQFFRYSS